MNIVWLIFCSIVHPHILPGMSSAVDIFQKVVVIVEYIFVLCADVFLFGEGLSVKFTQSIDRTELLHYAQIWNITLLKIVET